MQRKLIRCRGVNGYANDLHVRPCGLQQGGNRITFLLLDVPRGSSTEAPISLVQHRRMSCMHREHATSPVGEYGRRRTKLDNGLRTPELDAPARAERKPDELRPQILHRPDDGVDRS